MMKNSENSIMSELAYEYNLSPINVFPKGNGKSDKPKIALVDFEDYRRAYVIAIKNELNVEVFEKESFDSKWIRTGIIAKDSFKRNKKEFDKDCKFYDENDADKFFKTYIKPRLSEFDNLEDLSEFIYLMNDISDEIGDCGPNEFVVVKDDECIEVVEKSCMCYDDQAGGSHIIGLIMPD